MKKLYWIGFILIIIIASAYFIKTSNASKIIPIKTATVATTKRIVKDFNVSAFQFGFKPNTIEVNQGDRVVINLSSKDVTHGFYLEAYGINVPVKKGSPTKISFIADKKGKFPFICSVYCGSGHGHMQGLLVVK